MDSAHNKGKLTTRFAPPERESRDELRKQIDWFNNSKMTAYFLDAVPVNVTVLNDKRQIVYANKQFMNFINGEKPHDALGKRPGEAFNCKNSVLNEAGCGTSKSCSTCGAVKAILKSLEGEKEAQECRITTTDGTAVDLLVWSSPLKINGDKYSIFSFTNIGDLKRRRVLERIFFHDILNTAGSLRGLVQLLDSAENLEEAKEYAGLCNQISDELIEEILTQRELAAAETNELQVHPEEVNSGELLNSLISQFSSKEEFKGTNLIIAEEAESISFTSDKVLIRRVIANMTKNALEASHEGETVTLNCKSIGNEIVFSVHNAAVMPENVKLQVFLRSFSTKGNNRGLGTYSMKLLTERYLNGRIYFESVKDKGTTFTAVYPKILKTDGE